MRRTPPWTLRAGGLAVALALLAASPLIASTSKPAAGDQGPVVLPESYPWVRLAETATAAVVNVRVRGQATGARQPGQDPQIPEQFRRFIPPQFRDRTPETPERPRRGIGSGFVIDPSGYVVTNHHVVDGASTIEVALSDGRTLTGKVVGTDPETDLALLKVEASGLPTLTLGSSDALKVGEPVMAIGNPFGLDHTVTVGIISGTSRVIGAGRYDDFLQTDAAINPGNSGGPLINTRGEVVGIATAIASRSGGFQGVGFAIPIDLAKPIVTQLRTTGHVTRGWLGVAIQPLTPELAKSFGVKDREGALVASVIDGSPAARAGLRPGDVVVQYDGKRVESPRMLSALVAGTEVGRKVSLTVLREGRQERLEVPIGNLSDARQASAPGAGGTAAGTNVASLGIDVQPLTPERARQMGVEGGGKGVVVTDVRSGSPAAEAGLAEGDVIREVNRLPVTSLADLEKGLERNRDKQALLRVEREGNARYVVVEVG